MSNKSKDKKKSGKKGASKRLNKTDLSKLSGGGFSFGVKVDQPNKNYDGFGGSTSGTGG